MRMDPFFEKQPEPRFVEGLKKPMHEQAPENFGRTVAEAGEVCAAGASIVMCVPEWEEILCTAVQDVEKFFRVTGIAGERYPVKIVCEAGYEEESYRITAGDSECIIASSDSEGARRGLMFLEEEMIKREGPFLASGSILRRQKIRRRITRGFFSPTNRAPKWGDELLDEIDYYPEEYLNRLAHNGTNGLWIYTSFAQLVNSPYLAAKDEHYDKRMEKLARVTAKCKRYGVKVYVFAIEPMGLLDEEWAGHEDMLGADVAFRYDGSRRALCPRSEKTKAHIHYCLETIFKTIPDLAGYISITAGERTTTCASIGNYKACPRCGKYSRGENLAYGVDVIKEGLRRAGTGAEFISWTYGHRYWDDADIVEYIEKTPSDVIIMQGFEDRGTDIQLGKPRIAWDYWLSYPGPSDMFALSAETAMASGKTSYAKMQVCSSHEIATVPYIPAPGILFDKYKRAVELGVTGIMECWYFGNYPSLMNRASTELSYLEDFSDKEAFLRELAARLYGQSRAEAVKDAWMAFEESYRNYPTNIMFSYYGPMHDGVAWKLYPIPVNRALPRTWLLLDPPDGDRIGECLFKGHTMEEVLILTERMCKAWEKGMSVFPLPENHEHFTCASAIGILFASGRNILRFYQLREQLGTGSGQASEVLEEMERIVTEEIKHAQEMIAFCEADPRIGYHSEAEGFKFFPEKLRDSIRQLEALFETDFPTIRKRLQEGKHPLGCYYAEGQEYCPLGRTADTVTWQVLDGTKAFGAYVDGDCVKLSIRCGAEDDFSVCFEFAPGCPESVVMYTPKADGVIHNEMSGGGEGGLYLGSQVLSHQSVYREGIAEELAKYHVESRFEGDCAEHLFSARIPEGKWNGKTVMKLRLTIGDTLWKNDPDPVRTLGKHELSPGEFGVLLP